MFAPGTWILYLYNVVRLISAVAFGASSTVQAYKVRLCFFFFLFCTLIWKPRPWARLAGCKNEKKACMIEDIARNMKIEIQNIDCWEETWSEQCSSVSRFYWLILNLTRPPPSVDSGFIETSNLSLLCPWWTRGIRGKGGNWCYQSYYTLFLTKYPPEK